MIDFVMDMDYTLSSVRRVGGCLKVSCVREGLKCQVITINRKYSQSERVAQSENPSRRIKNKNV